jgi:hypothetical protein
MDLKDRAKMLKQLQVRCAPVTRSWILKYCHTALYINTQTLTDETERGSANCLCALDPVDPARHPLPPERNHLQCILPPGLAQAKCETQLSSADCQSC